MTSRDKISKREGKEKPKHRPEPEQHNPKRGGNRTARYEAQRCWSWRFLPLRPCWRSLGGSNQLDQAIHLARKPARDLGGPYDPVEVRVIDHDNDGAVVHSEILQPKKVRK